MKKRSADCLLIRMGVPGSFIIRQSETEPGHFSLSICDFKLISHYRIWKRDCGGYYIKQKVCFDNLPALVEHYKKSAHGLALKLKVACHQIDVHRPWEVPHESIKLVSRIGDGFFGDVWEGIWNSKMRVAVKMLKQDADNLSPEAENTKRDEFLTEAEIMKTLSHPNIVQLYAICSVEKPIYIILEFMCHGNLKKYLVQRKGLNFKDQLNIASQVAQGMSYLEEKKLVHRDIAARNILLRDKLVKIADFGLSRFLVNNNETDAEKKFSIRWTAPEAIIKNIFSVKSDVWSFGMLLYEMITKGKDPYPDMKNIDEIKKMVCHQSYKMDRPECCPEYLYDNIILLCWNKDPSGRPTFQNLKYQLEHYFLLDNGT